MLGYTGCPRCGYWSCRCFEPKEKRTSSCTVDSLVRCDQCEHYRFAKSTLRRIGCGMFSEIVGHEAKHECLLMPSPVKVRPQHKCGQFAPNRHIDVITSKHHEPTEPGEGGKE